MPVLPQTRGTVGVMAKSLPDGEGTAANVNTEGTTLIYSHPTCYQNMWCFPNAALAKGRVRTCGSWTCGCRVLQVTRSGWEWWVRRGHVLWAAAYYSFLKGWSLGDSLAVTPWRAWGWVTSFQTVLLPRLFLFCSENRFHHWLSTSFCFTMRAISQHTLILCL